MFVYNNYFAYFCRMKANINDKKCGIYCIVNTINNKKYIGKTKCVHRRIKEHIAMLNTKSKDENPYLIRSWNKYGRENFNYFILETLELDDELISKREIYWMDKLNTLDKRYGYNLKRDSSTGLIIHPDTSKKISERLKKEWSEGIRDGHSKKLKANWKNNTERKTQQSEVMSKVLTKYLYEIYDLDMNLMEICAYKRLVELNLQNVLAKFFKKKISEDYFKSHYIKRINS